MSCNESRLQRLYAFSVQLSHSGLTGDMVGLAVAELWAVYRFLSRLAGGGT